MEEIPVPLELQVVLREFTKTVLREKPKDVLEFSRNYFVEKCTQTRMASYRLPASESATFHELSDEVKRQVEAVFKRYDSDCDAFITIEELKLLMEDLAQMFGFSKEIDAGTLMSLLDSDGSSAISWQEWSHACAVWLQDMQGR
ncbi:hypothetical protein AB1Y20_010066 [Prymnesium parvum]|uniref:EF-hand domain-containing protein n=1 Tax=Prymnesium parvum TaxID=97485 RepID=A0AB34K6C0_PRYPA